MTYMSASRLYECASCSSHSTPIYAGSTLESMIGSYANPISTMSSSTTSYSVEPQSYVLNLDAQPELIPTYIESQAERQQYSSSHPAVASAYSLPTYQRIATQALLNPNRNVTPVISNAENIMHYIKDTFEKTTGDPLPKDITIRICNPEELKEQHKRFGGSWSPGILGFAINDPQNRLIFIKENNLDELMLTIGHEIGHVLSERLTDPRDEEAKAFAFEMAWMKTIQQHNIADLSDNFVASILPANNGLHDVAFDFVIKMLDRGQEAMQLFNDLFTRETSIQRTTFS